MAADVKRNLQKNAKNDEKLCGGGAHAKRMNEQIVNSSFFWYTERKKELFALKELLDWMEYIEDIRQPRKVRHKLKDILGNL